MIKKNRSRIVQGTVLFVTLLLFSCADLNLENSQVSKNELSKILSGDDDFNSFKRLYFHNKVALSKISSEQAERLAFLSSNIERARLTEIKSFLDEINFEVSAFDYLESSKRIVRAKYTFNSSDLDEVIAQHLSDDNNQEAQQFVITCDTYCTGAALQAYPPDPNDPANNMWMATARAIYYAGCMDGCRNGPHSQ